MFILTNPDGSLSPVFAQEIQKGIIFLNEVEPRWRDKIDPSLLSLASTTDCVLGQVFEDHYTEGLRHLSDYMGLGIKEANDDQASEYGFCVSEADLATWRESTEDLTDLAGRFLFSALTEEWINVLKVERQAKEVYSRLTKKMADLVT